MARQSSGVTGSCLHLLALRECSETSSSYSLPFSLGSVELRERWQLLEALLPEVDGVLPRSRLIAVNELRTYRAIRARTRNADSPLRGPIQVSPVQNCQSVEVVVYPPPEDRHSRSGEARAP